MLTLHLKAALPLLSEGVTAPALSQVAMLLCVNFLPMKTPKKTPLSHTDVLETIVMIYRPEVSNSIHRVGSKRKEKNSYSVMSDNAFNKKMCVLR